MSWFSESKALPHRRAVAQGTATLGKHPPPPALPAWVRGDGVRSSKSPPLTGDRTKCVSSWYLVVRKLSCQFCTPATSMQFFEMFLLLFDSSVFAYVQ